MRLVCTVLLSICAGAAFAGVTKPATVDLACAETDADEPRKFAIRSSEDGAIVTFDGKEYRSAQLVAGDDGGPAFMQVGNSEAGYTIVVEGGDLQQAFESNITIENGEADTHVFLFGERDDHYMAVCKGSFSFE